MAITWICTISNEDLSKSRANVSFKRVDDTTGAEFSVSYQKTVIETGAQRLALLDTAWAAWEQEQGKQLAIAEFITNLEQLAKANLEAREV